MFGESSGKEHDADFEGLNCEGAVGPPLAPRGLQRNKQNKNKQTKTRTKETNFAEIVRTRVPKQTIITNNTNKQYK